MRISSAVATGLAVAAVVVPAAAADGLPVLNVDVGSSGIAAPGGAVRYVTVTAGDQTIVEATRRRGGQVVRQQSWPGAWTIPAVAYDRTAGGLSADRRTLVLIEPRTSFPRKETRLLVVDAFRLGSAALVDLHGDFSFDALSPDGSRIFLIQYTSPIDPTRYVVRAYDVSTHRLLPKPIVDPRDATEKMRGNPLSRATSPDGRFAYTLYDGGGHPFVHALDTARSTARCIDLDRIPPRLNLWQLRLRLSGDGRVLAVERGATRFAALDTRTWAPVALSSAGRSWWPVAAAGGILAALAAVAVLLLRRRPHPRPAPVD
ncbi:MAG TPA: hypothetical protein VFU56_03440 [Gaiellaceae bacterium]|nr:hypothetical protein [Gaiellaceae bacterium]